MYVGIYIQNDRVTTLEKYNEVLTLKHVIIYSFNRFYARNSAVNPISLYIIWPLFKFILL